MTGARTPATSTATQPSSVGNRVSESPNRPTARLNPCGANPEPKMLTIALAATPAWNEPLLTTAEIAGVRVAAHSAVKVGIFARLISYKSVAPDPPGRFEKKTRLVPLEEMAGPDSSAVVLTVGPKFTGGDQGSEVLARVETHKSELGIPVAGSTMLPVRSEA